jgi:hypothetical protein
MVAGTAAWAADPDTGKSTGGGVTITPSAPAKTPAKAPAEAPAPAPGSGGVVIKPSGAPSAPAAGDSDETRKVAEIQVVLAAKEFDKAIEQANAFLKTAKDAGAKTEALRILAEALRKKGDWKQAAVAYLRLRDSCEKNSDDWVTYDAIAEILRASPAGVYQPAGAIAPKPPGTPAASSDPPPAKLSDDNALAEALARLAGFRAGRLKSRIATVTRPTTPQLVVAALEQVAEEAKQVFTLSADAPADSAHGVCSAAGGRMQTLGGQIISTLKAKIDKYQPKMNSPWSFTNQEKLDIKSTQAACKELAQCEDKFQQTLPLMAGKGDWPEGEKLRKESAERRASYEQLGKQYIVPAYTTSVW